MLACITQTIGCILWLSLSVSSAVVPHPQIRQLYQFPNTSSTLYSPENLAVRANGAILFTLSTIPQLYALDPHAASCTPALLFDFPGATASLGIAEVAPDIFLVATGNFSRTTELGVRGSFSVWKVAFGDASAAPQVSKLTDIPEAEGLNGMTTTTGTREADAVLIADSDLGALWRVDTRSGAYADILNATAFEPVPGAVPPLGINGVHAVAATAGRQLLFTNTDTASLGSVAAPPSAGTAPPPDPRILTTFSAGNAPDDFAIDPHGNAFVAVHPNSVVVVDPAGHQTNLTQNSPVALVQPTSVVFGRGRRGECQLFVTTMGEEADGALHNGQILEIDLCEHSRA